MTEYTVQEVTAYRCGKCSAAFLEREAAEKCCEGREERRQQQIEESRRKAEAKERERFQKAEKVSLNEYGVDDNNPVMVDDCFYFDEDNVSDHFDSIDGDEMPKGAYGWACKKRFFDIDAEELLINWHEDFYSGCDIDYVPESFADSEGFVAFIESWLEKQKKHHCLWEPDYSKAVLLSEQEKK